jgi:hypothetical protein
MKLFSKLFPKKIKVAFAAKMHNNEDYVSTIKIKKDYYTKEMIEEEIRYRVFVERKINLIKVTVTSFF